MHEPKNSMLGEELVKFFYEQFAQNQNHHQKFRVAQASLST